MRRWYGYGYDLMGGYFTLTGTVTLLELAATWHYTHILQMQGLGFCLLDGLVAYGFFCRFSWLSTFLILNTAGVGVLFLAGKAGLVALAFNAAVTSYVYATKDSHAPDGIPAGAASLAVWVGLFTYTLLS